MAASVLGSWGWDGDRIGRGLRELACDPNLGYVPEQPVPSPGADGQWEGVPHLHEEANQAVHRTMDQGCQVPSTEAGRHPEGPEASTLFFQGVLGQCAYSTGAPGGCGHQVGMELQVSMGHQVGLQVGMAMRFLVDTVLSGHEPLVPNGHRVSGGHK